MLFRAPDGLLKLVALILQTDRFTASRPRFLYNLVVLAAGASPGKWA